MLGCGQHADRTEGACNALFLWCPYVHVAPAAALPAAHGGALQLPCVARPWRAAHRAAAAAPGCVCEGHPLTGAAHRALQRRYLICFTSCLVMHRVASCCAMLGAPPGLDRHCPESPKVGMPCVHDLMDWWQEAFILGNVFLRVFTMSGVGLKQMCSDTRTSCISCKWQWHSTASHKSLQECAELRSMLFFAISSFCVGSF